MKIDFSSRLKRFFDIDKENFDNVEPGDLLKALHQKMHKEEEDNLHLTIGERMEKRLEAACKGAK